MLHHAPLRVCGPVSVDFIWRSPLEHVPPKYLQGLVLCAHTVAMTADPRVPSLEIDPVMNVLRWKQSPLRAFATQTVFEVG